jgi:serine/threonine-protein kinase RsbW
MELRKKADAVPPLHLDLTMPSEISAISPFVDAFIERLQKARCIQGDGSDIEVALREALANAVIHGNREDPTKHVHVSFRCDESGELFLVVRDEGAGFNPDTVPDPLAPENLAAEHGRGILMMRMYMDEVHFEHCGSEVHMRKKYPAAK